MLVKELCIHLKVINRISFIELLSYSIVLITFVIALSLPLFFHYVNTYSAPTAAYAVQISNSHSLVVNPQLDVSLQHYWQTAVDIEGNYPIPALLLAIFAMVTGIPKDYLMFTPIVAIANIVFFLLARRIFCSWGDHKSYGLLMAALFYCFVSLTEITTTIPTVGRATFGVFLLSFFLFFFVKFLFESINGVAKRSSWVVLVVLAVVIGYTYYVSTLAIIVLGLGIIGVLTFYNVFGRKLIKRPLLIPYFLVVVLGLTLFVNNAYIIGLGNQLGGSGVLQTFFNGMIDSIRTTFGQVSQQSAIYQLQAGFVKFDPLTLFLRNWVLRFINIGMIISLLFVLFWYRPKKSFESNSKAIWFIALTIVFFSISEMSYFIIVPPPSALRFLLLYSFLFMLFILLKVIVRIKKPLLTKIITVVLVSVVFLSAYGSLRYAWYYGVNAAKPFAYDQVQPLALFLCNYSSPNKPIFLTGDATYVANIFFISSLHNKTGNIGAEPLGNVSITLYHSLISGNMTETFVELEQKGISFLLIEKSEMPIYGDEWGYAVSISNTDALYSSLSSIIYDDGQSQLFKIPSPLQ